MIFRWLIEVVYEPNEEGRAARYFDGNYDLRWDGRTTMNPHLAQSYSSWEEAESDRLRLLPRHLGVWRVVQHGFEQ